MTSSYTVQCEEQSGITGVSAYPSSIAVASGAFPGDSNQTFATTTSSSPACTQTTSGSGTTEFYILNCNLTDTPTTADAGAYPFTFTGTGAGGAGTATSGTLTVTVNAPTVTCIAPAAGGSAATFFTGSANSYTVQCEEQSGISGVSAYPSSIAIASGAFPADATQTFATTTSSSPACTTSTSGSGTTEFYILNCALGATPTGSDGGTYPFTFTAAGAGGVGDHHVRHPHRDRHAADDGVFDPRIRRHLHELGGRHRRDLDADLLSTGFANSAAGNYPTSITINSGSIPSDSV